MLLRNVVYNLYDYRASQLIRSQIKHRTSPKHKRRIFFPRIRKKSTMPVLLFQTHFVEYSRLKIHASYN
jgi:hypothetical protein